MAINTGVLGGYNYLNITTTATTLVKSGAGILHKITFNNPAATGVITIYDSLTAAGTKVGTVTTSASPQPQELDYDIAFVNGLTIVTTVAAQDLTISFV